ncbi:sensor histidine kinase [Robertmurraya sp. Marseille-Q9965]
MGNHLRNKIFSKILFFFSATTLITMFILLFFLSSYYTDVIIQREKDASTQTLEQIELSIHRKQEFVQNVVKELYLKKDLILYDIAFALQNDYSTYLSYRLDKYSESSSFVPNNLDTFFQAYFSQDTDINAVSLKSATHQTEYIYVNNHHRWNLFLKNSQLAQEPSKKDGELQKVDWEPPKEGYNTVQISRFINDPVTLTTIGDLTVYYDTEGIQNLLKLRDSQDKGSVHIISRDGTYLFNSDPSVFPKELQELPFNTSFSELRWKGKKYYVNTLADDQMGYLYVGLIPENELRNVTSVKRYMLLATILLSSIAIAVTYFIMRSYSRRISTIDSAIHEVRRGNLQIRIPQYNQKDELTTISESFNEMLDDLNKYIKDVYVLNLQQRDAEMKALQSQIQPHFLYNTLEAIRMKAIADGSKTTSKMIYSLGQLFRYSLSGKEIVEISDEIEHVKEYVGLIQVRYEDRLKVTYDIPEIYLHEKILKFTLQPLVENYFIHGFRKESASNELLIQLKGNNQDIEIIVSDNGMGIPMERLSFIQSKLKIGTPTNEESIGLNNVHQRLNLKYGLDYGLTIQSKEGEGTIVIIKIPANSRRFT